MNKYEQIPDIIQRRKEFLHDCVDYHEMGGIYFINGVGEDVPIYLSLVFINKGKSIDEKQAEVFEYLVLNLHPKNINRYFGYFPKWAQEMGIEFFFYVMYFDYDIRNWQDGHISMEGRDTLDIIRARFIDEGGSCKEV